MYSLLFEGAAVLIEGSSEVNANIAGKAFKAGLDAVMKYGRAQPGDRTMLDALCPAVTSYISTLASGGEALKALEDATCAAEEGAKATLNMKASAGRASYVDTSELRHPDPGAHAIGIIMRAVFEGFKIKAHEMGVKWFAFIRRKSSWWNPLTGVDASLIRLFYSILMLILNVTSS